MLTSTHAFTLARSFWNYRLLLAAAVFIAMSSTALQAEDKKEPVGDGNFYQFVNATGKFTDEQISWQFGDKGESVSLAKDKSAPAKMGGGGRIYFKIEEPNANAKPKVYRDFIEYTHNDRGWFGNTTQVDEFVFPMTIELFEADGTSKKLGISESRAKLFEEFKKNAPREFQSCVVGTDRIVSPNRADMAKGKQFGNSFDAYVDEIWETYRVEKKTPGGWTGKALDGKLIFSKPGQKDYVLTKKPTQQDILLGQNELGKSADWCSAFNRHVAADPGDWRNPATFYKAEPCNYYAKFFHEHSLRGLAYGFCYDDFGNQAAYFEGHHPKKLVVTIYWDTPPKDEPAKASGNATKESELK